MVDIIVPTPGESITEVEVGSWLVENGSWVEQDQEIASIESEKATLEITAPVSGIVEILSAEGEALAVGSIMGKIKPEERPKDAGKIEMTDPPKEAETVSVQTLNDKPAQTDAGKTLEPDPIQTSGELGKIKLTPVAKKMMETHSLNMDDILSGLKRIGKQEVQQVLDQKSDFSGLSKKTDQVNLPRSETRKRMSLLRRKLAERLVTVKNQTAMLTTFNEVDMTAVMELRNKYKTAFQNKHDIKLGFMSFFSLAAGRALQAFPQINTMIDGEEMISFNYADIGIAVQTPKGLMVPVIRDVHLKSLAQIEFDLASLAEKARNNKISLEELNGGTFSITNGGVFGSLLSTPILNPPQSAILGMHNIVERPMAVDGQVVIRPMMYLALSYDHRIVDGKDSVGFLKTIKEMIENPYKMLDFSGTPESTLLDL